MNEEEKKSIEDMNRFANGIDMSCVTARQMQIILNLIKKLQKENKEWQKAYQEEKDSQFNLIKEIQTLKSFVSGIFNENIEKDFIPVQKVKDKIEELKKEGNYRTIDNPYGRVHFMTEGCDYKIQVLQELIEEREEK